MTSTGEVYLNLFGDEFNPDEVNQYIGLVGATVRRKGERRPEVPLPRVSSWAFSTGKVEDEVIDVYAMSEALITKLAPYVEKIVEVKEKFALTCVLQVVLWDRSGRDKINASHRLRARRNRLPQRCRRYDRHRYIPQLTQDQG
jgi:hypothetical protein